MPRSRTAAAGPVALLNGWSCPPGVWGGLDDALTAGRHDVRRLDLPGWDPSLPAVPDPRPRGLAAALAPRIRALGPLHALVGYSLGAQVALHLARTVPGLAGRVVLLAPPIAPAAPRRASARGLIGAPLVGALAAAAVAARLRRSPGALRAVWRRLAADPVALDLAAMLDLAAGVSARIAASPPRFSARTMAGSLLEDPRPAAPGVAVPVLIVAGADDPLCTPGDCRAMAAAMPAADVVTVTAAGHFPHMEAPDRVIPAVTRFLA